MSTHYILNIVYTLFFFSFREDVQEMTRMEMGIFVFSVLGYKTQELVERRKWKTMRHLMRCISCSCMLVVVVGYVPATEKHY